jgi:predicted HTH transcriptional regulator
LGAQDWTSAASGTAGLTGGCDTLISIERRRGTADAVMKVTGRDVDEQELALSFKDGVWTILGEAAEHFASETRKAIHGLLSVRPKMTPKQVAEELAIKHETAKKTLQRMLRDGVVRNVGGRYEVRS